MPSIITALLICASAVLGVFALSMAVRHFQRKRAFARMVATACVTCGNSFGSGILRTTKKAGYFWNPAPGYSVIGFGLQSGTFLVTCPHCSAETEFTRAGRVIKQPKEGAYLAAVVGCLTHAAAVTACFPFMLRRLYNMDEWFVGYLFLVSLWPLWFLPLLQFVKVRKGLATVIPMMIGLLILSPIIALVIHFLYGKNIWPVPQ